MVKCFVCRDEGKVGGCPKCGKEFIVRVKETSLFDDPTMSTITWDENKLIANHMEQKEDPYFKRYAKTLTALYNNAVQGIVPRKSLMIIADSKYGKHTFAYSMMNALQSRNKTCTQIIDHQEYLRLSLIGSEKPYEKLSISMEELIYSDFVVMSIDTSNRFSAEWAIKSLLAKRSHAGKVTFIISTLNIQELERKKGCMSDLLWEEGLDELRYLNILMV